MPLPAPLLDDLRFQNIVDQAKRLITQYCPEWTDHNVSDPGVTLIELFAWMLDMLSYRVNQVPDAMYIRFLEMIGVRLDSPRPARAPVTMYLSAAQPNDITIPEGTEVATLRTETAPAIVFTTERDMEIRTPNVQAAFTRDVGDNWTRHDLRKLGLPEQSIDVFPRSLQPRDSFLLAFSRDHSNHVLALVLQCDAAGGAGINPKEPPLEWQVYQGPTAGWVPCDLEYDGTGGFNWSGEVIIHLPEMKQAQFQGVPGFWLRCRLTDAQAGPASYRVSPRLLSLETESRGGTVWARHCTTVLQEVLGTSDGTPGQRFQLLNTPVLARDPERDFLVVEPPGTAPEQWEEVGDFSESGKDDRTYTLDPTDGTVTLGPALLQPDGSVYRFGVVPPVESVLRFSRYQFGGGVGGNVPRGSLRVLKSSIPYVTHVLNREDAVGGRDAQSLEDAKLRAPQVLRTRTRAVTADDYEYLATNTPTAQVARACCLAPGVQPPEPGDPRPGQVIVVIVPRADRPDRPLSAEDLAVSAEARSAVLRYLDERRVLGVQVEVRPAQYVAVAVDASLRLTSRLTQAGIEATMREAEAALYRYLNPLVGGPQGDGWPFGRDLHVSELSGVLQRIPNVEYVEDVRIGMGENRAPAGPRLAVPRGAVITSATHRVQAVQ